MWSANVFVHGNFFAQSETSMSAGIPRSRRKLPLTKIGPFSARIELSALGGSEPAGAWDKPTILPQAEQRAFRR